MNWYYVFALISLTICSVSCLYHFLRIVKLGNPVEYSGKRGDVNSAVFYSFTGAMSPKKKESAYLHLPTYLAGLLYHIGTFLSIFLFFMFLFDVIPGMRWMSVTLIGFLLVTSICGFAILIKRIIKKELLAISNPDDFISNILVTLFQMMTIVVLFEQYLFAGYFVVAGILLLYLPLGKLKHTIYFFAARYHLAYFYGWRDVWPPKQSSL